MGELLRRDQDWTRLLLRSLTRPRKVSHRKDPLSKVIW